MLYEIHMLKNYPPVNLNRDDTGAPKTCLFGGVNRGRISSQCLKRSWRTSDLFRREIGPDALGIRTRYLPKLVCDRLAEMGVEEEKLQALLPELSKLGKSEKREAEKRMRTGTRKRARTKRVAKRSRSFSTPPRILRQ